MKIDKCAPIIPYVEMGKIKLYSSMSELSDIIANSNENILNDFWVRYDVYNVLSLSFHRKTINYLK